MPCIYNFLADTFCIRHSNSVVRHSFAALIASIAGRSSYTPSFEPAILGHK
jgi:hypothetical protein